MSREDNPWRMGAWRAAYDNPWIQVQEQDVVDPAGAPRVYGLVRFKKRAVGVLPVTAEGDVHLVGQWRVPLARYSWEMPEGGAELGESPEACARRELEEEAGLVAGVLIPALEMDLSNSVTDEQAVCFIGWELAAGAMAPEPTEVLQQRRLGFRALLRQIRAGRIRDSLTVATALATYYMAEQKELPGALADALATSREDD